MTSTVTVLAYHRIAAPSSLPELAPTLIDAYPADFRAQMRYLVDHYNVISAWDLVRALRERYTLPRRAVIITFDDGYGCFRDTAWPVLKRLGLPVTLFVPTYFPSHPTEMFWWDALHHALVCTRKASINVQISGPGSKARNVSLVSQAEREAAFSSLTYTVERLDEAAANRLVDAVLEECAVEPNGTQYMLDWANLAELSAEGVSLGPHTRNHTILSRVTPKRARDEVAWSWADLQAHVPNPLPIFCYPNGKPHAIGRTAVDAVRGSGLAGAFTMVAGLNTIGRTDPFLMYRVGAVEGESLGRFRLKISVAGRVYRRLKSAFRGKRDVFKF